MSPRSVFDRLRWVVLAFYVGLVAALFISGHYGSSNDTLTYLGTAQNIAAGHGYVAADGHMPTEFAPLYPALLAVLLLAGASSSVAAGAVNALALSGLLMVTWKWARLRVSPRWAFAAVAAVAGGFPVVVVADYGWSEPLFITLVTTALWLLDKYRLEAPVNSRRLLLGLAIAVGLACMTRYAGALLLVSVVASLVLQRKWKASAAVGVISAIPIAAWLAHSAMSNPAPVGTRGPATISLAASASRALSVFGKWMVGPLPVVVTATIAGAGLLAAVVVLTRRHGWLGVAQDPAHLFIGIYAVGIVLLAGWATGISPPNDRLLAPLFPAAAIAFVTLGASARSRLAKPSAVAWIGFSNAMAVSLSIAHLIGVPG